MASPLPPPATLGKERRGCFSSSPIRVGYEGGSIWRRRWLYLWGSRLRAMLGLFPSLPSAWGGEKGFCEGGMWEGDLFLFYISGGKWRVGIRCVSRLFWEKINKRGLQWLRCHDLPKKVALNTYPTCIFIPLLHMRGRVRFAESRSIPHLEARKKRFLPFPLFFSRFVGVRFFPSSPFRAYPPQLIECTQTGWK